MAILERIKEPADLRALPAAQLDDLATEIRDFIVHAVAEAGGHLGSNLGAVELTIALHRVFESPTDAILWDTGHQSYVHKILTGRQSGFAKLRQTGGISGYPSREESRHDFIENSHASTVLSYAHGLAVARDAGVAQHRHVVAVIGDGSMTGGMAYEALNNLGHSKSRVIIVLNDNGRSYAPTISNLTSVGVAPADATGEVPKLTDRVTGKLSRALTDIRLNPVYVRRQRKLEAFMRDLPVVGKQAELGVEAVMDSLQAITDGKRPTTQSGEGATKASKITKQECEIDWNLSAQVISQKVRAFTSNPGAWTRFRGDTLKIDSVSLEDSSLKPGTLHIVDKKLIVGTGSNALAIGFLTPSGKSRMDALSWINGARITDGEYFG